MIIWLGLETWLLNRLSSLDLVNRLLDVMKRLCLMDWLDFINGPLDVMNRLDVPRWTKESAMCKLYCSDAAMKVTTDCVQMCGGIGYMADFPIEKFMRDAKITQIYEGTNQIQRNEIAMMMIKELASAEKTAAGPGAA